jgi:glycine betaine/choline ABC-type transport system substrate-binding protein
MVKALVIVLSVLLAGCTGKPRLVVASKPFTESEIVAELIAQLAESQGVAVDRRFFVGGAVCFSGVKSGDIDVYAEYTGTGLADILHETPPREAKAAYERVKKRFQELYGLTWLAPLGFNDTYALVMRTPGKLSQLKGPLRCGFDLEFVDRPDGYKGLAAKGYKFCGSVTQMSPGLMYDALANGQVDVISGYTTDGRIAALKLHVLEDDVRFFPPYQAAPLVGPGFFKKAPNLAAALEKVKLDDAAMTKANLAVDIEKRSAKEVARALLKEQSLP